LVAGIPVFQYLAKYGVFRYFSSLISKIFSRIFLFSRYEFWSSDVFKTFYRKNTFLNIFLNTKSRNVKFSQDTLFLMFHQEKMTKLGKKKSFWHFFWKINFWSIFVKLKIFYSPFSYQTTCLCKIIIKNLFQRIA
jgi:hypothetical protein